MSAKPRASRSTSARLTSCPDQRMRRLLFPAPLATLRCHRDQRDSQSAQPARLSRGWTRPILGTVFHSESPTTYRGVASRIALKPPRCCLISSFVGRGSCGEQPTAHRRFPRDTQDASEPLPSAHGAPGVCEGSQETARTLMSAEGFQVRWSCRRSDRFLKFFPT